MKPRHFRKPEPDPEACPVPALRRKRVTAGDVARCAGVSQATVSIVLSNRLDIHIPDSTRERIKRCAKELGYLPSLLGEGFLRGRSRIIGVVLVSDSYLPLLECIAGIQTGAARHDYVALVLSSFWEKGYIDGSGADGREREDEQFDVRRLLRHQVEGVLYLSPDPERSAASLAELARRGIPVVTMGVDYPASHVDFVGGDDRGIADTAAKHLLSIGCASFSILKSPGFPSINEALSAGFRARVGAAGHTCREFVVDVSEPEGMVRHLSGAIRPPAGIFAADEIIASLASQAAIRLGWRVPDDVAIVAAGVMKLAHCSLVPLTTVNRNAFATGQAAVELLIRRINGDDSPVQRILTPPSLEIRLSTMRAGPRMRKADASTQAPVRDSKKRRGKKMET